MRKLLLAAAVGALVAPATAVAGVINLQDGVLNVIADTGGGSPTPTAFSETDMGVTFTFIATDNLVGGGKFNGGLALPNGIHVGGGGGSSLEFQMTVDTDVTLTGYSTGSAGFELGSPIFDLLDGATVLIDDGDINPPQVVGGLSVALTAGTTYTFDINQTTAGTQGFFNTFEFDTAAPPVPVPAALPLAAAGFGLLGILGWRQRTR